MTAELYHEVVSPHPNNRKYVVNYKCFNFVDPLAVWSLDGDMLVLYI